MMVARGVAYSLQQSHSQPTLLFLQSSCLWAATLIGLKSVLIITPMQNSVLHQRSQEGWVGSGS